MPSKCFRADRAVGSPDVQRFAGTARALHGADIPVIVTTGRFSAPAITAAARLGIVLIDRVGLAAWAADGATPVVLVISRQRRTGARGRG
jgi:restriction system protein